MLPKFNRCFATPGIYLQDTTKLIDNIFSDKPSHLYLDTPGLVGQEQTQDEEQPLVAVGEACVWHEHEWR